MSSLWTRNFGLYFVDLDKDPELKRQETEGLSVLRGAIASRSAGPSALRSRSDQGH